MFFLSQTRAKARALVSVVLTGTVLGAGLGGILGGAYLAGGYAQAASTHARVSELADVASGGYAEQDLQRVVDRLDSSALAIARRHDPFTSAGGAQRDRQAAVFAARLERRDAGQGQSRALLLRTSFITGSGSPAARPFRLDGALDASRDLECLTEAVYYEARGETPAGQAAVAQVVLNRARHPAYPKTICGVVYQRAYGGGACQFSFACDGSMRKRRDGGAWARAERVATKALSGGVMAQVGNATHFHTIYVAPAWAPRLVKIGQVGLHVFYRFGGRSGAPGSFEQDPERSGDRPLFAGDLPGEPIPYASLKQPDEVVFIAATATAAPAVELVDGASAGMAPGMGGPAHKPVEPASAPKPVAKPVAKPAVKPTARAPRVETEASLKPEQTSVAAS